MSERKAALALTLAVTQAIWMVMSSKANEYSLDYSVEGGYEYNNNLGLDTQNESAASSFELHLPVNLAVRGDRMGASLLAEASAAKYDDSGYDHDDQNLQGNANYTSERGHVSGNAGYQRASTLDTEFLDTGIIAGDASRVDISSAGGAARYTLTEKNSIATSVNYSSRNYDNPRYQDFDAIGGYAGWLYMWSERTTLELRGTAGRFENESKSRLTSTSESLGFQAGFNSTISEQLRVSLLAGLSNVDSDYEVNGVSVEQDDENNIGYSVNGSLDYEHERYSLSAAIVRSLNPSGNGYVTEVNQLDVNYGYEISERMSFGASLVGGTSGALDSRINNDRNYVFSRFTLRYRFTQDWSVGGKLVWRYQDREQADEAAYSGAVSLSFIFHPESTVWSR